MPPSKVATPADHPAHNYVNTSSFRRHNKPTTAPTTTTTTATESSTRSLSQIRLTTWAGRSHLLQTQKFRNTIISKMLLVCLWTKLLTLYLITEKMVHSILKIKIIVIFNFRAFAEIDSIFSDPTEGDSTYLRSLDSFAPPSFFWECWRRHFVFCFYNVDIKINKAETFKLKKQVKWYIICTAFFVIYRSS